MDCKANTKWKKFRDKYVTWQEPILLNDWISQRVADLFMNGWPSCSYGRKLLIEWLTKAFERIEKFSERLAKPFERTE